jgi:hypothetical protein
MTKEYEAGWNARRANLPHDPNASQDWRNGWNDAERDDHEESEFYS